MSPMSPSLGREMTRTGSGQIRAVVPVAGSGSRLRPHTHTRPKPLLHVAGKPILGHILDQLSGLGIERIVLIVNHLGEQITEYVRELGLFAQVESVVQEELLGLGYAVLLAQPVVGQDPMLVVYGDTIFRADLRQVLGSEPDAALGTKQVEDPSRFGVLVEEGGEVVRLVEKPTEFVSDRAIVGVNYIRNSGLLFQCLEKLVADGVTTRGEYQLTDALQWMVDDGARITSFPVEHWFDCGTLKSLLATNRHLLEGMAAPEHARESVIVPPVHIAAGAQVRRSVLGPYVSVGDGVVLDGVIARDTIIGAGAQVSNVLLESSLVGYQAVVEGRASHLSVGDQSEIST